MANVFASLDIAVQFHSMLLKMCTWMCQDVLLWLVLKIVQGLGHARARLVTRAKYFSTFLQGHILERAHRFLARLEVMGQAWARLAHAAWER